MADTIQAQIQASNTGQIATGKNIVQVNSLYGDLVTVTGERVVPRARAVPVLIRPRPFPNFLDRLSEVTAASDALQASTPVEIYGKQGVGKTTFVRYMAHHASTSLFPSGVICLPANRASDDLLQSLFDALYESDIRYKPSDGEIRQSLQAIRAAVMLDDVDVPDDQATLVINAAPTCAFLLASTRQHLWGEGTAIPLRGLDRQDALMLIERTLGRPLTAEEEQAAASLSDSVHGNPLALVQVAGQVREAAQSLPGPVAAGAPAPLNTLVEAAQAAAAPAPAETLNARLVASVSEPEQRVLATLAAIPNAFVTDEHLTALAELQDPAKVLGSLDRRSLVETNGNEYRLAGSLGSALEHSPDVASRRSQALPYFIGVAEARQHTPDRLVPDHDAIVQLLHYAVDSERWSEALRLVRACEGSIALAAHWALWEHVLTRGLEAARRVGDSAAEAWALHQLGTRLLCLGELDGARNLLTQALRMRESLGDHVGAAVTRHNLEFLSVAPPPTGARQRVPAAAKVTTIAVVAVLLIGLGARAITSHGSTATPTAASSTSGPTTKSVVVRATLAPTFTPMPNPTATATSQPTPTWTPEPPPTWTPEPTSTTKTSIQ